MTSGNLTSIALEYVEGVLSDSSAPRKKGTLGAMLPRYNVEYVDLEERVLKNKQLAKSLIAENAEGDIGQIVSVARGFQDSRKSGLAIGYLFPDMELELNPDDEFDRGLRDGQIYSLKNAAGKPMRWGIRGGALAGLGALLFSRNEHLVTQENIETIEPILNGSKSLIWGGIIYGLYSVVRTKLFANDMNISDKLHTRGLYALHRNPFYAGVATTLVAKLANDGLINAVSENPAWIPLGIYAAGISALFVAGLKYTKGDERVLEKTFGQEYRDYKSTTNRFLPNPFNLLRRHRKS